MGWKIGVFPMDYMFFDIWVFFFMNDWHCWKKFSEIIQQKESGICPSTQNLAVFFFFTVRDSAHNAPGKNSVCHVFSGDPI